MGRREGFFLLGSPRGTLLGIFFLLSSLVPHHLLQQPPCNPREKIYSEQDRSLAGSATPPQSWKSEK